MSDCNLHNVITKRARQEVVLVDIKDGIAQGKALDIWQSAGILNYDTRVTGVTNDYSRTAGSSSCYTSGSSENPV